MGQHFMSFLPELFNSQKNPHSSFSCVSYGVSMSVLVELYYNESSIYDHNAELNFRDELWGVCCDYSGSTVLYTHTVPYFCQMFPCTLL